MTCTMAVDAVVNLWAPEALARRTVLKDFLVDKIGIEDQQFQGD